MEPSRAHALVKRSSDYALMPPPPPTKRQRRPAKVLDEDVYSDALSHIIARDFFPGLLETEAQRNYIEALESDNVDWIREAGRKLTQIMTPLPEGSQRAGGRASVTVKEQRNTRATPREWAERTSAETPVKNVFAHEKQIEVDVNMSLGAFQAKYTSEDNESFNELLDRQNHKRALQYGFFHHGNQIPTKRRLAYRETEQKLLGSNEGISTSLVRTNGAGQERRAVSGTGPSENLDARPASIDGFPNHQGPRNHFMFGPEGVDTQLTTSTQPAEQASSGPMKSVEYAATRFSPTSSRSQVSVLPSPSLSAIDAAIAGNPRENSWEDDYSGAATPRVNGYAFVDAEPTPCEMGISMEEGQSDVAEREVADRLLPKADQSGPNPFTILSCSSREDLHMKLVDKADANRRKGNRLDQLQNLGITPGRTPTPRFSSCATGKKGATGMTPAAQKLAEKFQTPKRTHLFGSGYTDKGSWVPTPRSKQDR